MVAGGQGASSFRGAQRGSSLQRFAVNSGLCRARSAGSKQPSVVPATSRRASRGLVGNREQAAELAKRAVSPKSTAHFLGREPERSHTLENAEGRWEMKEGRFARQPPGVLCSAPAQPRPALHPAQGAVSLSTSSRGPTGVTEQEPRTPGCSAQRRGLAWGSDGGVGAHARDQAPKKGGEKQAWQGVPGFYPGILECGCDP